MLVVVPFALFPEGSAAARYVLGLLRGLELQGAEPLALTVNARGQKVPQPPPEVPAESAYVDYPSGWLARRERLSKPFEHFRRGEFGRRLGELSADVDVAHISGIAGGALFPQIRSPAIVQLDNLTRLDQDLAAPWTRQGRDDLETLLGERRTRRRARWILANSDRVAAALQRESSHAQIRSAPLCLDPAYYPARASLAQPVAGLIGTAAWPPTADAVRRLLTRVWPLVLERRPTARLLLAGRGMERRRFADCPSPAGVEWVGPVESAEAFLQSLGVLLYPLERGSGAKIKVLESILLGVPVVTTPSGAEGIAGTGGVIVEHDDQSLARAACTLLDDATRRRRMGEAAVAQFQAHHSPEVVAAQVISVYEQMLR